MFILYCVEPPKIEGPTISAEVSVAVDELLELVCNAAGVPPPQITWEKDGQPLSSPDVLSRNGTVLRIDRVKV